ncbi:MAG TPA: extracellular solute-binding protein [Solirubrobacterales bacterium]
MKSLKGRLALALAMLAVPVVAACGGTSDASGEGDGGGSDGGGGGTINLVAYSTPQEVYEDHLIPAFQKTPEGEGTNFTTSFAGSGDSRRAIESGIPTDLAHLALEPDTQILVEEGILPEDYRDNEYRGIIQNSVVVIVTRPGNPENIRTWDDVLNSDLEIINANPFTSGGARWNVMAVFGQAALKGGRLDEQAGLDAVRKLLEKVPSYPSSARDALNEFLSGKGDVLLSYENEAIQAQNAGEDIEYIVPDSTLLIETPGGVPVDAPNAEGGQAFLEFLWTDEAQRIWAENGFRPVNEEILAEFSDKFPQPKNLFTIEDLGGWEKVMNDYFDPDTGKIAEIQKDLGGPTE